MPSIVLYPNHACECFTLYDPEGEKTHVVNKAKNLNLNWYTQFESCNKVIWLQVIVTSEVFKVFAKSLFYMAQILLDFYLHY